MAMSKDPLGREHMEAFCRNTSVLYQMHWEFVCKFVQIATAPPGQEQVRLIRKFHMKMAKVSFPSSRVFPPRLQFNSRRL